MPGTFWTALSVGLSIALLTACSPATEENNSPDLPSLVLPMTFGWDAPARLNVRETAHVEGRRVKIKYDLIVERFEQMEGHLILSFNNVTPIELDGQQINMFTDPVKNQQEVRLLLVDFYSRPSFIVTPDGRIAAFTDVEKSIRARLDISQSADTQLPQSILEEALADQVLVAQMQSSSDAVWSCLVRPWLGFNTPIEERLEQAVSLVIFEGADPAPATRTNTNAGFVEHSESLVSLESVTVSRGVELARVLQQLAYSMTGESEGVPDIEGVATATNMRTSKVRLDPVNLKPHWAQCTNELTIDSTDDSILPSASRTVTTEFEIQWL